MLQLNLKWFIIGGLTSRTGCKPPQSPQRVRADRRRRRRLAGVSLRETMARMRRGREGLTPEKIKHIVSIVLPYPEYFKALLVI